MPDDAAALARVRAMAARARRHDIDGPGSATVWHAWGAGEPLVLLHGGSGSWTHWIHNIDALARSRRVFAGDLPGCGDSASPPAPYDGPDLGRIVAGALDRLLPGGEPFDLVGFSFGGIVAGHLAPLQSPRLRSLTLVGSPLFGLPSGGDANALRAVDPALDLDAARPLHEHNLAALMFADPACIDALALRIHHDNLRRARLRSRRIARSDGLSVALERVSCPVHGIWGERDVTVHPGMQALRDRILATGAQASFEVIPGAGHWAMFEAAGPFNALLASRLARPETRPSAHQNDNDSGGDRS